MSGWVYIDIPDGPPHTSGYECCQLDADDAGRMHLTIDVSDTDTPATWARWLRAMADAVEACVPWVEPDAG